MLNQTLNLPVSNPLVGVTTISGAITFNQLNVVLGSATGVVTPSLATGQAGSYLFCNGECMQVTGAGTGTAAYRVKRGLFGTPAQAHLSGAIVWIGNAATTTNDPSRPNSGALFPVLDASPVANYTPAISPGSTVSTAVPVAGTIYYSQINVTHDRPAKGIMISNSATVGTDNWLVALYDFAGNLLANSAVAGALNAGANLYQCFDFLTPVELSGGRSYFIAFQSNGTTAVANKYITGQVPTNYQAGSLTGTFGTVPATIAFPGTFTTAKGPLGGIY